MSTPPSTTSPDLPEATSDERMFALIAHLSPLVCLAFIGPLITMLVKQDSDFVKYHSIQALVYQAIALVINVVGITIISVITCGMGSILAMPIVVVTMGGSVWLAVQSYNGSWEGYPMLADIGRPQG